MAREPQVVGRGAPAVGTVVGGYRFDGGNHRDRSNWTQVDRVDVSSEYGPGAVRFPNGTLVRVGPHGGVTEIKPLGEEAEAGGAVDVKEFQANAAARATLMDQGETDYQRARLEGYDPTSQRNSIARWTEGVPILGVPISNLIRDSVADRGRAAELQFTDGALRTTTGANAPEPEVIRADRTYFRQPGEDEGVDPTRSQIRQRFRDQAVRIAGDAYISPVAANAETGERDPETGLPTYPKITETVAGVQDSITPGTRGEDRGERTDEQLIADGYERGEDGTWRKNFTVEELEAQGLKWDSDGQRWTAATPAAALTAAPAGQGVRINGEPDTDRIRQAAANDREGEGGVLRKIDTFAGGVLDGLSFGLGDEIGAGISTVLGTENARGGSTVWQDGLGAFDQNLAVIRGRNDADAEQDPWTRGAGQVTGAVASSAVPLGAAARGAQGASLAVRVGRNALAGAGSGAVYGFGAAEGNALERLPETGQGALVGTAAGVAAPVIGNALLRPAARGGQSVARFLGRQVGRAGEALNVPNSAALTQRATRTPLDTGLDKLGNRLGAERSNALVDRANTMANEDLTPTLVDALDEGGRGLVRGLATRQPARQAARDFVRQRRIETQANASDLARRYVSDDPRTAGQALEEMDVTNRALSAEEYAAARAAPPITIDPDTTQALWGPEGRSAMQSAARLYASSADPAERALSQELATMARQASAPEGGAALSVGAADLLARHLQRAGGTDQNAQRIFGGLGRAVRQAARNQSEAYDQAVTGYAERAQITDAMDVGRQFTTRRGTGDYARRASALTPEQSSAARIAARDAIEDRASTPAGAQAVLDDFDVGAGANVRSAGLIGPDEAAAMSGTARQMRARIDNAYQIDPRAGSPTNLNQQDSAVVDGLEAGADMISAARLSLPAIARVSRRFRSLGFSDNEARALVEAAVDPARSAELITRLSQRTGSRREARNLERSVRRILSQNAGASQ